MTSADVSVTRIGIIGCGNIAPVYASTLKRFAWLELAAVADGDPARAEAFAARTASRAMAVGELIADPSIELVINLTPAHAHAAVTGALIDAGKHVFSEKPLGVEFAEGRDLLARAAAAGLRLGCAPDTVLGAGLQAARAAIDRGAIGTPLAASAFMLGFGPEWWHPNPEIFYGPGAGPLFDMGPYYLSALSLLLGPVAGVSAAARIGIPDRVIHATGRVGDVVRATVPTHVSSLLDFESGAIGTLVTSFDVKASRFRNIEIYGTEATLSVPDPNTFGGPLRVRGILNDDWRDLALPDPNVPQQRGIGAADMISAVRAGRPHRASGELALHVLETMTATLRAAEEQRRIEVTTRFERPAPIDHQLANNTFD